MTESQPAAANKEKVQTLKVMEDLESRPHCKKCRRRHLDAVEEDYQEEAQKRKVGKKEKRTRKWRKAS